MDRRNNALVLQSALVIVVGSFSAFALATDDVPQHVREKAFVQADQLRERLVVLTRKEGFETILKPVSQLPVRIDDGDSASESRLLLLGNEASEIAFAFSAQSSHLRSFFNWYAAHQCSGKDAPLYDEPTKPKWSKKDAERIAQECVTALLDVIPPNVVVGSVEYLHPFREMPKYYIGQWYIQLTRVDGKGHPFDEDGITVILSEKHGLIAVGVHMDSEYAEVSTEPISEKRAVSISEGFARKMLVWKPEKSYYLDHELSGEHHARLFIVKPNYILKYESIADAVAAQTRVARLAWEVRHTLVRHDAKSREAIPTNREVFVWIDATTGDYLGGDFK